MAACHATMRMRKLKGCGTVRVSPRPPPQSASKALWMVLDAWLTAERKFHQRAMSGQGAVPQVPVANDVPLLGGEHLDHGLELKDLLHVDPDVALSARITPGRAEARARRTWGSQAISAVRMHKDYQASLALHVEARVRREALDTRRVGSDGAYRT